MTTPLRTITVPLLLIGPAVKTALLNRSQAVIDANGSAADAYFTKVINRLNDATAEGKITIPVAILDTTIINAMKARLSAITALHPEWVTQFRSRISDASLDDGT